LVTTPQLESGNLSDLKKRKRGSKHYYNAAFKVSRFENLNSHIRLNLFSNPLRLEATLGLQF